MTEMSKDTKQPASELFFAFVGSVGTDFSNVQDILKDNLDRVGYTSIEIKLSSLLDNVVIPNSKVTLVTSPEDKRITSYMDKGNNLRKHTQEGGILSLLAISKINEIRKEQDLGGKKVAYIIKSLKHPDEVHVLRRTYGEGFFLIGAHSSYGSCLHNLAKSIGRSKGTAEIEKFLPIAEDLIKRDQEEPDEFGQRVRDSYHLADVFVSLQSENSIKKAIGKFIELIFGNTFHTPTKDEYLMFFAHVAASRSASLARQVGAVIATERGEILSVGVNDVPSPKGGLYWVDDEGDCRDHIQKEDSNTKQIYKILDEVVQVLKKNGVKTDTIKDLPTVLKNTRLMNLTEFGRMVHAEMDAITQAARIGVSVNNGHLFTTVFPCHNCAKHIIAAGIKKVIYIEPYPKSLASDLHKDAIAVEGEKIKGKVFFRSFVGIGPRRYLDLFSLITSTGEELKRKDIVGDVIDWDSKKARLRLAVSPSAYLDKEIIALAKLDDKMKIGEQKYGKSSAKVKRQSRKG